MTPEPWAPLCMEPDEWRLWVERNPRWFANAEPVTPCADCPLGFAADQRAIGRCNGTPGGVEEDEDVVTITEVEPKRRAAVEVALPPCGDCVHREVCAIRPTLPPATGTVPVPLPELHAALTPSVTLSIACGFYLPERKPGTRAPKQLTPEGRERLREGARKTQAKLAERRRQEREESAA